MKNYNKFNEVSADSIKLQGWLYSFLQNQANGLTGHLEEAGFPFNTIGWDKENIDTEAKAENPKWWVYEQTTYWIDGMERCGELLNDEYLLKKADKSFRYILDNCDSDGYLGPKEGTTLPGVVMCLILKLCFGHTNLPETNNC